MTGYRMLFLQRQKSLISAKSEANRKYIRNLREYETVTGKMSLKNVFKQIVSTKAKT